MVSYAGQIWVIGGSDGTRPSSLVESLDLLPITSEGNKKEPQPWIN